jgi:hypothetical protein
MTSERMEALMRIVVGIISGIILGIWKFVISVLAVIHWFYVMIVGKRNPDLARISNQYCTQAYKFVRYMTFVTNERVFPFEQLDKDILPTDMKKKK